MINTKYCKKCKEAFDIATNFDICPKCRNKKEEQWKIKNQKITNYLKC